MLPFDDYCTGLEQACCSTINATDHNILQSRAILQFLSPLLIRLDFNCLPLPNRYDFSIPFNPRLPLGFIGFSIVCIRIFTCYVVFSNSHVLVTVVVWLCSYNER
ncbi:hypothetical protein LXL04_031226 [Taraxacum kok-saghyz]